MKAFKIIGVALLALAAATGWGIALAYHAEEGELPDILTK